MKTIRNTSRLFALALVATAITTGFLASATPGHAAYYCHWTAQYGTVCNANP